MTYGLRIDNLSGVRVLDSEVVGYRYFGSPSVYSTGAIYSSYHQPHTFRVTLNSASDVPIVFVRPQVNQVVKVANIALLSGTTWEISVYGISLTGYAEDMRNTAQSTPTIYVFCPMSASTETHGLRLYNTSGVCTFDSSFRPLSLRGAVSFPYRTGGFTPSGGGTNMGFFNYDAQSFSGITTLGVIGNPGGNASIIDIGNSGETGDEWEYGWTLISGQLARHRFWVASQSPDHTLNWTTDTMSFTYNAMTALCIEASGL